MVILISPKVERKLSIIASTVEFKFLQIDLSPLGTNASSAGYFMAPSDVIRDSQGILTEL